MKFRLFLLSIVLPLISLFSPVKINAACPTPLAAAPGDTIWEIADRIQAIVCGPTFFLIRQTDIPLAIGVTGVYCLAERVAYAPGVGVATPATMNSGIFIMGNRVTLDLNRNEITVAQDNVETRRAILCIALDCTIQNGFVVILNIPMFFGMVLAPTFGIQLDGAGGTRVRNVRIRGLDNPGPTPGGVGLQVVNAAEGSYIENVYIRNALYGIEVLDSSRISIKDSYIQRNENNIRLDNSSNITVKNCILPGASANGVHIADCSAVTILDTNVQSCLGNGIFLNAGCTNCEVRSCVSNDNTGFGIDNNGGGTNRFYNNSASNNTGGGFSGVPAALVAIGNAAIGAATFWVNAESP